MGPIFQTKVALGADFSGFLTMFQSFVEIEKSPGVGGDEASQQLRFYLHFF